MRGRARCEERLIACYRSKPLSAVSGSREAFAEYQRHLAPSRRRKGPSFGGGEVPIVAGRRRVRRRRSWPWRRAASTARQVPAQPTPLQPMRQCRRGRSASARATGAVRPRAGGNSGGVAGTFVCNADGASAGVAGAAAAAGGSGDDVSSQAARAAPATSATTAARMPRLRSWLARRGGATLPGAGAAAALAALGGAATLRPARSTN